MQEILTNNLQIRSGRKASPFFAPTKRGAGSNKISGRQAKNGRGSRKMAGEAMKCGGRRVKEKNMPRHLKKDRARNIMIPREFFNLVPGSRHRGSLEFPPF